MANGGVIKQVKIKDTDTTLNIGSVSAEYIGYSANGVSGVSNVKNALDNLFTNQGSGSGSGSGNAENITYTNDMTVKGALDELFEDKTLEWGNAISSFYNLSAGLGNEAVQSNGGKYVFQIIYDCKPGDVFEINTTGGNGPRGYAFVDANMKIIEKSESGVFTGTVMAPVGRDIDIVVEGTTTTRTVGDAAKIIASYLTDVNVEGTSASAVPAPNSQYYVKKLGYLKGSGIAIQRALQAVAAQNN